MLRFAWAIAASAVSAAGCSCISTTLPLCQRIDQAKVLFLGTAIETNDGPARPLRGTIWYRFKVEEAFRGIAGAWQEAFVDPGSGTDQISYAIGKRYLISSFADARPRPAGGGFQINAEALRTTPPPTGPLVHAGGCSGSKAAEEAAEDLAFLRQYRDHPRPARVFGSVRVHSTESLRHDRYPPLAGALVRLAGPADMRVAATDQGGAFEFADVPPGTYALAVYAAGYTPARAAYLVAVPANGCGFANVGMFSAGYLAGRVLRADGSPAPNLEVSYRWADRSLEPPFWRDRTTRTDRTGAFAFSKVPPGELLLGVNMETFPKAAQGILPTYWPGTTDLAKAQPVRLELNERRNGLLLRLGPPAPVRQVTVDVRWPDGRPAAGAWTALYRADDMVESQRSGAGGKAVFTVFQALDYWFAASFATSYRKVPLGTLPQTWVDAERAFLPAGSGAAEVPLRLMKPGGFR